MNLPVKLYSTAQVREMDRQAIQNLGIPGATLMERAGIAAFAWLKQSWPEAHQLCVLAGTGNNGGDGLVVARLALLDGWKVQVLLVGDDSQIAGDARLNLDRYLAAGGQWKRFDGVIGEADVLVDALLGTGLSRPVGGVFAEAIQAINQHPAQVLALDIPSGLDGDTGAVLGSCVQANKTLTFIGLKPGLFTGYGPEMCGEVGCAELDLPPLPEPPIPIARRIDWQALKHLLGRRSRLAHKGHFGHVLVVGGAPGYGGAARLAAEAALRVGAGLVTLATHPDHVTSALTAVPELMVRPVQSAADLEPLLAKCSVLAIGPGLGQGEWGRALWELCRRVERPQVVDADALNLLALEPDHQANRVITPHPGEAARLLGICSANILEQRMETVSELRARYGGAVVLKGAGTLVLGSGLPAICSGGNPGMASGGMGDVLTGIIAGLLAQGWSLDESAELGVCVHAQAADDVAQSQGERGMTATDVIKRLPRRVNLC